ncbi:response regulator [candidate division KSB3 bacterium]|nr:response regulator [candidate division KSB3 bacterium]
MRQHRRAAELNEQIGNRSQKAFNLNNLAATYCEMGECDLGLEYALQALEISHTTQVGKLTPHLLDTIGTCYLQKKQLDQAREYLHQAVEAARRLDNGSAEIEALLSLATILQQQHDPRALPYVEQALARAENIGVKQLLARCHRVFADLYEQQGDVQRALHYYKRYHTIQHEFASEEAIRRAQALRALYETEAARNEARVTREKNAELEQEVLERRRAEAAAQRRAEEMAALADAGREISASLDLPIVLERIAVRAKELLRASTVALLLRDVDADTFRTTVALGQNADALLANTIAMGQGIAGSIARNSVAEIINDVSRDPRARHIPGTPQNDDQTRALMCAPLTAEDRVIGLMALWRNPQKGLFDQEDLEFFDGLARQAAIAIVNARLFETAQHAKRVAEDAQEAAEAAQRASDNANRAKSTFLANMSHELRTPLNVILGFAQIMTRRKDLSPEVHQQADLIMQSGEYLLALINQVLDLSKIEAGRMTLTEKRFDLHRLLTELEHMFQFRAHQKGLVLTVERTPDLLQSICTDEVKLRQVLINLLSNAIKFTKRGSVSLRVSEFHEFHDVTTHQLTNSSTHQLLFEVSDTGPGIAPDEIDQLFEAFVQTQTGRESLKGTGLGLPISRKFVELMGGKMSVQSEVRRGTVFSFTIQGKVGDGHDGASQTVTRRVVGVKPGASRYRILVVDDHRENRQILIHLLQFPEFDLREAENGQEAVELWEQWQPHLIFMDIRMPVLDGYDATRKIRKLETRNSSSAHPVSRIQFPGSSHVPIIAVTASVFEEEKTIALSAGYDDFLRKPLQEATVFELLSKHLGIQYIYEDQEMGGEGDRLYAESPDLTSAILAALPETLRNDLKDAAIALEIDRLRKLIPQIEPYNAALAATLENLVSNYRFDLLLSALEQ